MCSHRILVRKILAVALVAGAANASCRDNPNEAEIDADSEGHVVWLNKGPKKKKAPDVPRDPRLPPSGGEWDIVPLGAPGKFVYPASLKNVPKLGPYPRRKAGLVLYDSGKVKPKVVCREGALMSLATELAWHLERMSGESIEVSVGGTDSAASPILELGLCDGEQGRTRISRKGNRILVCGRGWNGVSHGVTYVLEAIGCRYLWPGALGKVIPRRTKIILPEIALDFVPVLKVREIREYRIEGRESALDSIGIDSESFNDHFHRSELDDPGNRSFFAWHGLNDRRELQGSYQWGHFFSDYYQRFHDTHPEWFALQMQKGGTRDLELRDRPERPTLCLSNCGLAQQTAKDVLADLERYPGTVAHSICLPDGSYPGQCMCRACRALDPSNGERIWLETGLPVWLRFPYVSLSDRVMTFNNRVAELVTAVRPDARLCCYVYSCYKDPTLTVKPHPALVLLSTVGNYSVPDRRSVQRQFAAWKTYGNPILWRPNALQGWLISMPQNIARPFFDDLEALKANGILGFDFDNLSHQWSNRGFLYYAVAKAALNPDGLDFDTVLDDYCASGFGAAGPHVKEYLVALEKLGDRVAAKFKAGTPDSHNDYALAFKESALTPLLETALKAAVRAKETDAALRVKFLARGLLYARWERKLAEAVRKGDREDVAKIKERYLEFIRANAQKDAIAVHPRWLATKFFSPNMR